MTTEQVWTDAAGNRHGTVSDAPRIVSLVPSVTELLCDLGLAHCLVGRTGFCIHPQEPLASVPKVGGTKDVNVEKIRKLAPTHLIVNIDENEKPCVDELAQFVPHVVVTHPRTLDDNLGLFELLGGIFNVLPAAQGLAERFLLARAALRRGLPSPLVQRRVLYCIWRDPWMTVSADTYIADMLAQIGWQVLHRDAARYPSFTWTDAGVANADLVLLSSEPYRFDATHVEALQAQIGKPVLLVDGEMMSWYGSRSIAGIDYLGALARRTDMPVMSQDDSETARTAGAMIALTLQKDQWTHAAHLRTGLWHVLHHDDLHALDLMRARIRAYNVVTGGQNTETGGYHETITRFYLLMIRAVLRASAPDLPVDALAERVLDLLGEPGLPFRFYSRDRLLSPAARAGWHEPDLAALPERWPADQPTSQPTR